MYRRYAGEIEGTRAAAHQLHGKIVSFLENRAAERAKIEQDIQVSKAHQGQAYLLEKLKSTVRSQTKSPVQSEPAQVQTPSAIDEGHSAMPAIKAQPNQQRHNNTMPSGAAGPSMEPSLLD